MKVIDLLNKIANGEEVPKKIKYENNIYILLDNYCYFCDKTNLILSDKIFAEHNRLNDEVEIIEEDKDIEEIFYSMSTSYREDIKELYNKVNELVKAVNELKKGK